MTNIKKNLNILELSSKPKLIISKELQSRITYLHSKVGKLEWSGVLFYKIVSGDIKDPDNFILKAENIFLKDIGNAAYTEYGFDENDLDMFDEIEDALELKKGHIHTHHTMNTFFSGTDTQELQDNAPNHNYYLSLIVNFDCDWCAKIAFIGEKTGTNLVFKGSKGNKETLTLKNEQVLITLNCTIELEADDNFIKRYEKIKKEKESKVVVPAFGGYMGRWNGGINDDYYGIEDDKKQMNLGFDKSFKNHKFSEDKTREFLCKLLSTNIKETKTLYQTLDGLKTLKKREKEAFLDTVLARIDHCYAEVFKKKLEDLDYEEVEACITDSLRILKIYKYIPITIEIMDTLELHLGLEEDDDFNPNLESDLDIN